MSLLDNLSPGLREAGKAAINAVLPNDFEYYVVTLELTDSKGRTVEYLTFPVNPSTIAYDSVKLTNIKKSMGGVTALDTESYYPEKISLSGMFGRKLRILISPPTGSSDSIQSSSKGVFDTLKTDGLQIKTAVLDAKLKTGYGTTKILESIVRKSSSLDEYNKPNRLYLYIPPLGHSFLIKINSFQMNQEYPASNMLWRYSLSLTTLAKVSDISDENDRGSSLLKLTAFNLLQKGANAAVNSIKNSTY